MHLIELVELLERTKVARGNILLVDVLVVASGDREAIVDETSRKRPAPETEPEVINVTGMGEDQIDEIRAEHPTAKLVTVRVDHSDKPSEPCNVEGCTGTIGHEGEHSVNTGPKLVVPCNHVHVTKGRCVLEIHHPGDHSWKNPNAGEPPAGVIEESKPAVAELTQLMEDAAAKLPEPAPEHQPESLQE